MSIIGIKSLSVGQLVALVIFQHQKGPFGVSKCSMFTGTRETFNSYICKLKVYEWR
uniref:Uncharacterized protein n=1 Tax=Arundo donax TaxID=35708 RepID=A0A0A8ZBU7_ARUDO